MSEYIANQVVETPMVEAFERTLDRYWRGHPQLYDFSAKNLILYHNELARETQ